MHPKSKAELLKSTLEERATLEKKIGQLTPAELEFPGAMGEWSVKDILQHLVDWEQRWMGWYKAGQCNEPVVTPEGGYNWRQMGLLNENYRQKHIDKPIERVLADFHSSYEQIMLIVELISEDEMLALNVYPWTGKLPLIAWIAGNTCNHYRWAIQMIRLQSIRRKMQTAGID